MKSPYSVRLGEVSLWRSKTPLVATLEMELTERCNNNCIHCYINLPAEDRTAKEKELSTEEIKAILEEAASLGCLTVKFTGGEPLMRDDFEEIYLSARKLGLKVVLLTNATLITPMLTRLFERTPPLEKIEITIYGMKKSSYESVTRVSGSFEAARRGIDLLLERGVPFVVKGVVLPPNRGEIEDFESWASTIPWMDRPPSYSVFLDLRCRRDSPQKNNLIKGMRLSPEDVLGLLTRRREEYLKEMREFCSRFTKPPGKQLFSCGAGIARGCVDGYGNLQPCILLRHPDTVYNLKKGSLTDAVTTFFQKIRRMKAQNLDYLAHCARCFLNSLCEQCPAHSWMEHGTLDTQVDYFCEIAHAQARYLGLLGENERSWQVQNWRERIKAFVGEELTFQERNQVEEGP